MGWLLGIDTATRRGNVAIARVNDSGTLLEDVHLRSYEGALDHAERLLREVDELLREAQVHPDEITAVAVGVGPGSFTGVRAGVMAAKGLAFSVGARLIPVGSLETMARACQHPGPRLTLLDARRGELFAAVYGGDGAVLLAPEHLPRSVLPAWLAPVPSGVLLGEVEDILLPGFVLVRSPETDLPGGLALLELALTRSPVDAASLEPSYLRPPDAMLSSAGLLPTGRPRLDSASHGRDERIRARASVGAFWAQLHCR
ncbi:MAG: tRNA (adenosine(37)-N6)-threonylcarbamoyltransferase complex dimerization subunit type 1 TsaB [Myxococcales bacterium]|nr:tRNA (adenosine(37)-N6)-threonylcarbamoyltransferase complex dimerization subunit type 1 TsaB [Polyangiaceae bacterium]MDW8249052.1 tRNA (adenosine(37)-N6)-threonylcarbamoyltransferase complex dimerization subunit type 1 TsaB [Myxococcales bacterium]